MEGELRKSQVVCLFFSKIFLYFCWREESCRIGRLTNNRGVCEQPAATLFILL